MQVFRISRKKTAALFGGFFYRNVSAGPSSGPPNICYIMGAHGPIPLHGHGWADLKDHLRRNPLAKLVPPPNHLLPTGVTIVPDQARDLLRSAVWLPHFSHENKESYAGAFDMDNVGVLEPLNMIVFRSLVQDPEGKWCSSNKGFAECAKFFDDVFACHMLTRPYALGEELRSLTDSLNISKEVPGSFKVNHPFFLKSLEYAEMSVEAHRLLRKECYVRHGQYWAHQIVGAVGRNYSLTQILVKLQNDPVMNDFLPDHLRNPKYPAQVRRNLPAQSSTSQSSTAQSAASQGSNVYALPTLSANMSSNVTSEVLLGQVIIDHHRNCCSHSVEKAIYLSIKKIVTELVAKRYTREDIIMLLRFHFPRLLSDIYDSFISAHCWPQLKVETRFPVPAIYRVRPSVVQQTLSKK